MVFYEFTLHLMYPNYPIFCSHVSADQLMVLSLMYSVSYRHLHWRGQKLSQTEQMSKMIYS